MAWGQSNNYIHTTHLAMLMVQVQGTSGIIDGAVLSCLNAQAQLSFCQMSQGSGFGLLAFANGHHQGRVRGGITCHFARMTQQKGLQCRVYFIT